MSTTPQTDRLPLRKRFGQFFKKLTTPRAPATRARTRAPPRDDQFHYVISAAQEDEIRESFLIEKLRGYTQSLTDSDFESIMMDKSDADNSIEDSCEKDDDCEAENGFIFVPLPGTKCHDDSVDDAEKMNRKVPNSCAICLSSFEPEDRVTWSSNKECTHVFHHSCIIDWLNSSGRRQLRRRRRQGQQEGVFNYANDPLRKITRFPMPCPCCRQVFALCSETNENAAEEVAPAQPAPSSESAHASAVTGDDHPEQLAESVETAVPTEDLDEPEDSSCVSDEAAIDDDACTTDMTPMTALTCPIAV
ncbi:hypothetical protein FisN_5Lh131 [Fistulifera solaris]|uniref:RING-type E3 ubiquitin transferase n=1 Tax=Fistulifera solaris TaxID=1519565 RepID=A0A1Z5JJE6_FISSO|nr:hypothetical protein FisN_5Lh131 [Fistulifera solaris]|eukprot:GAX13962.1 hypothetical protein FisN_5Lh131 [Fistulifera solaris]